MPFSTWSGADARDPREPGDGRGDGGRWPGRRTGDPVMMARRRMSEVAARPLEEPLQPFPEVAPFATAASDITCRQGAHAYIARKLALRGERVLFHDPRTGQLGIARVKDNEGVDAM